MHVHVWFMSSFHIYVFISFLLHYMCVCMRFPMHTDYAVGERETSGSARWESASLCINLPDFLSLVGIKVAETVLQQEETRHYSDGKLINRKRGPEVVRACNMTGWYCIFRCIYARTFRYIFWKGKVFFPYCLLQLVSIISSDVL